MADFKEEEDIRKKYPSLPPNYVSLAQLQERWLQQKQKQTKQEEQRASENRQQPKEKNRLNGSPQSSKKNGLGRIRAQGLHGRGNGELRVDANTVYVPRRQSDGNLGQIREAKSKSESKAKKLGLRASGDAGGSGMGNAKDRKANQKKRWPIVKEGLNGEDQVQTLSENGKLPGVLNGKNGEKEGYPGYENRRVHEIISICTVELAPKITGEERNPGGFSRKPRGKQVADDQISSSSDSQMVDAKSRGKQVVDDQFLNSTESQMVDANSLGNLVVDHQFSKSSDIRGVEAKSSAKQVVNGQSFCSTKDQRLEANYHGQEAVNCQFLGNTSIDGCVNENKVGVLPENGPEDEVSSGLGRKNNQRYTTRNKRSGNFKRIQGEGNVCTQEVLQDNDGEEVSLDERGEIGKERLGGRFRRNGGNRRMNRNSNERELKLNQLLGEDVFMGNKERTGPEVKTDKGARSYGNNDRVYHWNGRDFGDLSFCDSRKGNSSRGHRWSYGNFGISRPRKVKQVDSGLVWVKKEEKSDTNAEIS